MKKNVLGTGDYNLAFDVQDSSENQATEQAKEEVLAVQKRKVGRPKGTKGGGPKRYDAIKDCEETVLLVKIPLQLKEAIDKSARANGKTVKEVVTKCLMGEFLNQAAQISDISAALSAIAESPASFINLPEEYKTEVTLQAALATCSNTGLIMRYCPESLKKYITKEQWLNAVEQDANVLKYMPANYKKAAIKHLSKTLNE